MYTKPLSPSGLKLYQDCPRLWADKYIYGNAAPSRSASDRGTELHLLLELFFKGLQPYPSANKTLRPWQRFMEALSIKQNSAEGEMAVKADWAPTHFDDPEANYRGKIDLELTGNPNIVDVFDWKSGKIYPEHEFQGLSYCAMSKEGVPLYRTHFVYLDIPTHVETRDYQPARIVAERGNLDAIIAVVRHDTQHLPKPGPKCFYCHLSWKKGGSCRAAR